MKGTSDLWNLKQFMTKAWLKYMYPSLNNFKVYTK